MKVISDKIGTIPRFWQLLYLALGTLIMAGLWFSASSSATAHHPKPGGASVHLYSQHSSTVDEYYCIDSHYAGNDGNDLDPDVMRSRVRESLEGNGDRDWDFGNENPDARIYLIQGSDPPCGQILDPNIKKKYRLEYHGWRSNSQPLDDACGDTDPNTHINYSCAVSYDLTDGNPACRTDTSQRIIHRCDPAANYEADYYFLNLQSDWLSDNTPGLYDYKRWRHVINHETGHAFGLKDPLRDSDDGSGTLHDGQNRIECRGNKSIMEKRFFYNCMYNQQHPRPDDLNEVMDINNDTGHAGTGQYYGDNTRVGEDEPYYYATPGHNEPDPNGGLEDAPEP